MKKNSILLSAVLCLSLMTFVACGSSDDKSMNDDGNKSVTEETVDRDNSRKTKQKDDSVTQDMKDGAEDMKDGAEDAVDDVKDAMDGNDTNDSSGDRNNR